MIEAKELTRYYGDFLAVDKASFSLATGEIVGLLGPNGAGKTTIMKMLTTYLYPSAGTAVVGGKDITQHPLEVRKIIGYLPENLPLYPGMEVREYLSFVGQARGLFGRKLRERLDWVKERCGLTYMFRHPIGELSKGFRQRTALAQALLHDPQVVILDEPTNGLDPHQIIEIRNLIQELAEKRTLIISTHILQEMENLAERFIIIDRGKIVADGTLAELRERVMKEKEMCFVVKAAVDEVESVVKGLGGVRDVSALQENGTVRCDIRYKKGTDLAGELLRAAGEKGWSVREIREKPASLERLFLSLTLPEGTGAGRQEETPFGEGPEENKEKGEQA